MLIWGLRKLRLWYHVKWSIFLKSQDIGKRLVMIILYSNRPDVLVADLIIIFAVVPFSVTTQLCNVISWLLGHGTCIELNISEFEFAVYWLELRLNITCCWLILQWSKRIVMNGLLTWSFTFSGNKGSNFRVWSNGPEYYFLL